MSKPTIDLSGPDGNIFVLMGYAKNYAKQLDLDGDQIIDEMTASDYDTGVEVFEKYFGEYVDLVK